MLQVVLIVGMGYMLSGCAVRMNGGGYDSTGAVVGGVVRVITATTPALGGKLDTGHADFGARPRYPN